MDTVYRFRLRKHKKEMREIAKKIAALAKAADQTVEEFLVPVLKAVAEKRKT